MRLIESIFLVKNLLSRFSVSDDSRLNERAIGSLISARRAAAIDKAYFINQVIDPVWLQDMGKINFTRVTSSDDPQILNSSLCLGKITLPPVVSLQTDRGVYRISSSSKQKQCYPISTEEFFFLYESDDDRLKQFSHYFRIGNAYYVYPYQSEGSAILILADPLQGFVKLTENIASGSLTYGDTFIVLSGQIVYGGTTYNPLQTFVAVQASGNAYTGTGIVQYLNKKRKMTMYDEYPIAKNMESEIILSILSSEFKIEASTLPDAINDARDNVQRQLQKK
jgi:hypothetical protein